MYRGSLPVVHVRAFCCRHEEAHHGYQPDGHADAGHATTGGNQLLLLESIGFDVISCMTDVKAKK